MCWPILCMLPIFFIFERCLDSNPESCRGKQALYPQKATSNTSKYKISLLFLCFWVIFALKPTKKGFMRIQIRNTDKGTMWKTTVCLPLL